MKAVTIIAVSSLLMSVAPAHPQATSIINELAGEYQECSVYFTIASEGISRFSDSEVPRASILSSDYKRAADAAMKLAVDLALKAGVTPQAFRQRTQNIIGAEKEIMQNNYVNISPLNARYGVFCQELMKEPKIRLQEIQAGKICTGKYTCWQ